jgi:large subunit ribosomal protein L13
MKSIIDASGAVLGRLASFAAKRALKGDEVAIVNCEKVIITGNRKDILEKFEAKRGRVGSGQTGPKHSRLSERIVRRTIRGMLPNHREGRGREALKRVMCYPGIPKELESSKMEKMDFGKKRKFIEVREVSKK